MNAKSKKSILRRVFGFLFRLLVLVIILSILIVLPWRWYAPPLSAYMVQQHGFVSEDYSYTWVPLTDISPNLAIAVVAAEDQLFPQHHGFDFQSIQKALLEEDRNRPRGASTITQQLAKNLFLWPERSYLRKGVEAYVTVLLELLWPKSRILEVYLNVIEYHPGVYGAEAASQVLLNKSALELSASEATLLAAVLPNPARYTVKPPSDYVKKRSRQLLREINNLGGAEYLSSMK